MNPITAAIECFKDPLGGGYLGGFMFIIIGVAIAEPLIIAAGLFGFFTTLIIAATIAALEIAHA